MIEDVILTGLAVFAGSIAGGIIVYEYGRYRTLTGLKSWFKETIKGTMFEAFLKEKENKKNELAT